MYKLAAIYHQDGRSIDKHRLESLTSCLYGAPQAGICTAVFDQVGIGVKYSAMHEKHDLCPVRSYDRQAWMVFKGEIDNPDELNNIAFSSSMREQNQNGLQAVIQGYLKYGANWFEKIYGRYLCLIYEIPHRRLVLCSDPMGEQAFCYHQTSDSTIITTDETAIIKACFNDNNENSAAFEENKPQVAAYFNDQPADITRTLFNGIRRLPSTHVLELTPKGSKLKRFFSFPLKPRNKSDIDTIASEFTVKLGRAVKRLTDPYIQVPILLSGGLDSTSIVAVAHQSGSKLIAVSHVFDRFKECDERSYLSALYKKFSIKYIHVNADECLPLSGDPEHLHRTLNHIWLSPMINQRRKSYPIIRQQAGRCFLTGEFGDHLFGAYRYWLRDLMRSGQSLSSFVNTCSIESKRSTVPFYKNPVLRRLLPFNGITSRWRHQKPDLCLTTEAVDYLKQYSNQLFHDDSNRFERDRYEHVFNSNSQALSLRISEEARWYDLKPLMPFRDRALVEFTLNLPAFLFYNPHTNQHKFILRYAMKSLLPEVVIERTTATVYNSIFRKSLTETHRQLVYDILFDPACKWPEYVQTSYIETLLKSPFVEDYDLILLWKCLCYELWQRKRKNLLI